MLLGARLEVMAEVPAGHISVHERKTSQESEVLKHEKDSLKTVSELPLLGSVEASSFERKIYIRWDELISRPPPTFQSRFSHLGSLQ